MTSAETLVLDAVERAISDATPQGARLGVACSGGLDSLVLADAAARSACREVMVLHVDHGLSPGSAEVAASVAAWAAARGLAFAERRVRVPARASLEDAARSARYAALAAMAQEHALAAVATAHTARDQAETVLLRLLRGTGVAGLAAIPAHRPPWLRPLLRLQRDVIEAYAAARAIAPWEDPMNDDARFARVRVRREILPALRRENPALDDALIRLAEQAAQWVEAIDEAAAPLAEKLSASALAAAPAAVRRRALALALAQRGLGYDAPALDRFDELVRRPQAGSVSISLPGGAATREYDVVRVQRAGEETTVLAPQIPPELEDPARYVVRAPQPGDRMRPERLRGRSRKLADLFVDAKVPRRLRSTAQVVCRQADGEIVWAEFLGWSVTRE